jgi:hypothetical protein
MRFMQSMKHLTIALGLVLLDACVTKPALVGTGVPAPATCRFETPCFEGGSSDVLMLGAGVLALAGLLGAGALIHQLSRGAARARRPALSPAAAL